MNKIEIDFILDYCDYPQIFIGKDEDELKYISLLINTNPYLKYIAIKISNKNLKALINKVVDLREIFTNPESRDFFYFTCKDKIEIHKCKWDCIPDEFLPKKGYHIN